MTGAVDNPFPGLRPFRVEERELFFGREGQSEAILRRLRDNRLLVLVGPSGSGKSSLINAGLLPHLRGGFLSDAGSHWRISKSRPQSDPIGELAAALCAPAVLGSTGGQQPSADDRALTEVTLRGSSIGLIDAVRLARLPARERIVVIIDQFEELFRFASISGPASHEQDAALFVRLLLEAAGQREVPIYVVLGLRSDYIGDCARFPGLPEAVMAALYLIPRMTREQQREAITGPVRFGGASIVPRLVNRLLNDISDDPDQLPILQHALMRTWEHWRTKGDKLCPIDLADYDAIGGMTNALSIHADDAYSKLADERSKTIARLAFQCLSGKDVNSREARHPATVAMIAAVADVTPDAAVEVIDHFRRPDRAFLTPQWGTQIDENSIIDISHESLIRGWDKLRTWVKAEAEDAKKYWDIAEAGDRNTKGEQSLWQDPELQLALDWRETRKPNEVWAKRYHPGFATAMNFLDRSRDARDAVRKAEEDRRNTEEARRKRELKFQRSVAYGALAVAAVIAALGAYAWLKKGEADAALALRLQVQTLYLASLADQRTRLGDAGTGLALALDILPDNRTNPQRPYYPAAELQVNNALRHLHESLVLSADSDPVLSAAFSPDGRSIVTASAAGVARIWEADTGEIRDIKIENPGGYSINDASFSPDGRIILTASDDGMARLWDATNGNPIAELKGHTDKVRSAAFSQDGTRVVTASGDGKACVWDVGTFVRVCTPDVGVADMRSAAFSPDGGRVVTGSGDGSLRVWNAKTMEPVETPAAMRHDGIVTGVLYSPNGAAIVSSSLDGTVAVWDAASGERKFRPIVIGVSVNGLAISPDGGRIVTALADNTARTLSADNGESIAAPLATNATPQPAEMHRVAFSSDGRRLITASDDGTARVWNVDLAMSEPLLLRGHRRAVRSAVFNPQGTLVLTTSDDGTAQLWDVGARKATGHPLVGQSGAMHDASFSPDGKLIVTAAADGSVRIWNAESQQPVGAPFKTPDTGPANSAAFSPDGKRIVTTYENGSAWIWDIQSHTHLPPLGADARGARSAVFSRDGRRVLTAHRDGTARIWDASSGGLIVRTLPDAVPLRRAAYSPDDTVVVASSAIGAVSVWDADTLKRKIVFGQNRETPLIVYGVAFSPDGRRILTAVQDRTARLLDAATGQLLDEPFKAGGEVYMATFAPDGDSIVTASADGIARVWKIMKNTEALVRHGKRVAPRCLAPAERRSVSLLPPEPEPWCKEMKKYPYR